MTTQRYRLVIGNKNWSSWSLRPWLAMKRLGLPFEEINIRLRRPESKDQLLVYSPSGLVPTLLDGDLARYGDDGTARAYLEAVFAMPEMAD